jgi:predicted MPP superfamily phosphohydrolase
MVISLFVFTICAIAPFYWTVSPKIVAVDIKTEKISKGFDGYKIVQLSDMHFDFFIDDKLLQATVDSIEKLQPDVIMITGDIVTYKADELKPFLKTLRQLQAPDGVYFVMGNHDYGSYYRWKTERESLKNDAKLLQYFERLGWKILRNKSDYLICRNDTIAVAGTENKCFHQSHYPCDGDIELALREVPVFYPVIVMTHDPVYWEEELRYNERPLFLTLSGHTHGMQIGYRTKTKQWGLYRVLNKYSNGLYYENEKYLYINSGLGTVGFPFRIGLNPEITLLTLKHPAS